MAEKEIYYVKTRGTLVEVTPEVYYAYYRMAHHDRYLEEADRAHGKFSLEDWFINDCFSEESLMEPRGQSVEDAVITGVLAEQLRRCISNLSEREQAVIHALFYDGLSQQKAAKQIGISQRTVSYQKGKIIEKLRKMMKVRI